MFLNGQDDDNYAVANIPFHIDGTQVRALHLFTGNPNSNVTFYIKNNMVQDERGYETKKPVNKLGYVQRKNIDTFMAIAFDTKVPTNEGRNYPSREMIFKEWMKKVIECAKLNDCFI